jgi:hypothetical protein
LPLANDEIQGSFTSFRMTASKKWKCLKFEFYVKTHSSGDRLWG